MNFYPFHIGDYLSATRHLSWEEDAAYRRLLDVYYTTERALPADLRACCRLVLATTDSQREAVRVVLEEFFTLTPEGWFNRRVDAELNNLRQRQEKQRDKANKRWHKPQSASGNAGDVPQSASGNATASQTDAAASKADATAMPPVPVPVPINTPLPPKGVDPPEKPRVSETPGFARFWEAWPANDRKQARGKCWEAWKRAQAEPLAELVLAHIGTLKASSWLKDGGQFVPAPLVYLNQRRWEGAITDETPARQWEGAL